MEKKIVDKFVKSYSFEHFKNFEDIAKQHIITKIKNLEIILNKSANFSNYKKKILRRAIEDLLNHSDKKNKFTLKDNTFAELERLNENQYLEYIFHRYRYYIV